MVNVIASVESVPGFAAQNSSSPFEAQRKIPDFSIAAVGDMGCSSSASELVHDINNKIPELILALGDLSYQRSDASCWFKLISPLYNKMKIVLGDHDYGSNSLLKQYKSHFNMSQEYYSFNYENIHLIALATEIPFDINSSQYNFVKNDLEAASINPDIKWILVYSYRPQYSSPSKHPGNGDLRDLYHPLFQKYNVDVVIQAHNHNYQRTYPIKYNPEGSSNPYVTETNTKNYVDPANPVYVTVGTGGAALHKFNGKAPYVATQYMGFGFLDISITSNGRNMTGSFYSSSDNLVKDSFTLLKSG
jgi:hypothetical protein